MAFSAVGGAQRTATMMGGARTDAHEIQGFSPAWQGRPLGKATAIPQLIYLDTATYPILLAWGHWILHIRITEQNSRSGLQHMCVSF
jgi:hypothetical protein